MNPRILLVYFFGTNAITLGASCMRALRSLRYEVFPFSSNIDSPVDKYFFKYVNKILRGIGLKKIDISRNSSWNNQNFRQRMLEKAVKKIRPDILFVMRGHGFDDKFLKHIKGKYNIKKLVGWWIKGPKWFDIMLSEAKVYDHYFCMHKDGYTGADKITYLPALALDDILYRRLPDAARIPYTHDITFVGSWSDRRQDIIEGLSDYPISIYGPRWKRKNILNRQISRMVKAKEIVGEDLVELYNKTKIGLNISQWDASNLSGLNLRVFDIPACGTFLITEDSDGLKEYFKPGEEIETFKDISELKDKLSYYLKNDTERERIALNGYRKVLTLGTYRDKMADLLKRIWFEDA